MLFHLMLVAGSGAAGGSMSVTCQLGRTGNVHVHVTCNMDGGDHSYSVSSVHSSRVTPVTVYFHCFYR